jgi:hypothetical protein
MKCITEENEEKLKEFFNSIYISDDYTSNIKEVLVKIMCKVFTNDEAKVIKNLGLDGAKELDCFFKGISEFAKGICFRIAIFSELKIAYHCPKCLNKVLEDGTVISGEQHEKEVDYTPYHQTEEGKIRFSQQFEKLVNNRTDQRGITIAKLISTMNVNPLSFDYFGITFNEYFQLLKFINIDNTEDISQFAKSAEEFLSKDLVDSSVNQLVHKIILKKILTHYCNAHPYQRIGFSNRSDMKKLIKELYPTWSNAIELNSEPKCLRQILSDCIGESISCNLCKI